ncbi:MAG TPA: hypothetical protein VF070_31920 [Streptosporangiaceae bacterium]
MSRLEDRLRDAYAGQASTVMPESIHSLGEAIAAGLRPDRDGRPKRRRRVAWPRRMLPVLAPLGAAATVTVITVLAAMVPPRIAGSHEEQHRQGATSGGPAKFLIVADSAPLVVRAMGTGALVARIPVPSNGPRTYVGDVATMNGRDYLLAMYRPGVCRSWLYQFRLNSKGQPTAVTPFASRPTLAGELYSLTISGNGSTVGYATADCPSQNPHPGPSILAIMDIRTGQTKQWTVPGVALNGISLSADASLLCYSIQMNPSVVRVIPTSSAPGPAASVGRTVADGSAFGSSEIISYAAISPDGRHVYFTTFPEPNGGPGNGQVRAADLATGHSRLVSASAGKPGLITADPSVSDLLLQIPRNEAGKQPYVRLAKLDLLTGTATYLPSSWLSGDGDVISW